MVFTLTENLSFDQAKIVVEATENKDGGKDLFMKGICIQGGVRNANQRVYPCYRDWKSRPNAQRSNRRWLLGTR